MIKIGVCGAAGRMGKTLQKVIADSEHVILGAAIEHKTSPAIGADAGEIAGTGRQGVHVAAGIGEVADDFDVLIDFTLAEAVIENLRQCHDKGKKLVIGATGLSDEQKKKIQTASHDMAIVLAPNMSIGVNLCFKLTELAARIIGESTDIEIIEAHHNQKKDAPSGTAVRLGEIAAGALHRDLKECAVYGREGAGGVRNPQTIGFETIRAGDIVGEHTVMFAGAGERVEIKHVATNRKTFARGAVRAAQWIMEKQSGLYDMQDVLGLR